MVKKLLFLSAVASLFAVTTVSPALAGKGPTAADPAVMQAQLTCMATAVDKREVAIQAALDVYYTAAKTSLQTRQTGLKAAWAVQDRDARKKAIKDAWTAFKGTWRNESKKMNKARNAAWQQFNVDRKACGVASADEPRYGED